MSINFLRTTAVALTAATMLGGCGESEPLKAVINKTVEVQAVDGRIIMLTGTTAVNALCLTKSTPPLKVRVLVTGDPYKGETVDINRADLLNMNDPYGAGFKDPPQDPFKQLPAC